ncbi:MAG: PIG-L family deacetylase [Candidatus Nanopelagicus sp.]|nr:PIG-L family deacetylase [Candidatus Nanopelagicus sp.]
MLAIMEPLNDSEIERVLVVVAHPDDCDFGAAGTTALWSAKGIKVSYCIATNGDQGGEDLTVPREEMPKIRQREQREAGKAVGVSDITFLNYRDGWLEPTIALRKDIVRQIRITKPDRMVIQSPERNWDRIGASHPDHLAAGEAAIQAVYPDARNPFAFEDLIKDEGLQPWRVKEVWVMSSVNPDHFVDITSTFDKKMKALHSHVSQTAHNENLEKMVREWGEKNAQANNLPAGSVAEVFRIVSTN